MIAAVLLMTTPCVPMIYQDLIALRRNQGGGSGGLLELAVDFLHRHDES